MFSFHGLHLSSTAEVLFMRLGSSEIKIINIAAMDSRLRYDASALFAEMEISLRAFFSLSE